MTDGVALASWIDNSYFVLFNSQWSYLPFCGRPLLARRYGFRVTSSTWTVGTLAYICLPFKISKLVIHTSQSDFKVMVTGLE